MHRVLARNDATESENRIHADDVARQYGFSGGLVPGVTVFAYLCHEPAAAWGTAWIERGTLSARFVEPVYDGEDVRVDASETIDGLAVELWSTGGSACARGVATLPDDAVEPPDVAGFPPGPLPEPNRRPPVSADVLSSVTLGSIEQTWRAARAADWLDEIGEDVAVYREDGIAHPGWLLRAANHVLGRNVRLGPWIHVSSDVTMHGVVRDGDVVSTRGRVVDLFERKGHRFVTLDVLGVVGERPVLSARHTAIYEPRLVRPGSEGASRR
jgi:acyl dehydratase